MEDPDDKCISLQPIVFCSEPNSLDGQIPAKKAQKRGILKQTKDRNSTPRPILKGGGRKRFSFSPSLEIKQTFKRSAHNDLIEERGREIRKMQNLMADLSEVADFVNIPPLELSRNADGETPDGEVTRIRS